MSLMGTLAKVAIGVAIAKGVGAVIQNSQKSGGPVTGAGSGGAFGGPNSPRPVPGGSQTGLEDIMKSVLGGGQPGSGQTASRNAGGAAPLPGGLGGLLEQLGGGSATGAGSAQGGIGGLLEQLTQGRGGAAGGSGGLGDLLGQLTGQRGAGGASTAGMGGLGDLLGGLLGGAAAGGMAGGAASNNRSFGDVLNQSLQNGGEPDVQPTPTQEAAAALMLRAMIQAAKADGTIDAAEKAKLTENLSGASNAEMQFVRSLVAAPVDVNALVRDVPKGLEQQVYTMSVLAIALDNQSEADYLHALAQGLGIGQQQVNAVHAQLGVPALYT